jgi:hypothetical protein
LSYPFVGGGVGWGDEKGYLVSVFDLLLVGGADVGADGAGSKENVGMIKLSKTLSLSHI